MVLTSFVAGQVPNAADYDNLVNAVNGAQETLWVLTDTAGFTAIGASGTEATNASLTAPSSTYLAHTAYRITIRGLLRPGTSSGTSSIRIRDTNAVGTTRLDAWPAFTTTVGTNTGPAYIEHFIANTTGSNITRVLCVTMSHSAAGGISFNASAQIPWFVMCQAVGLDTEYPHAVAL